MGRRSQIIAFLLVLGFALGQCRPEIEAEKRKYRDYTERIEHLIKRYPSFGVVLKQAQDNGRKQWKEAKQISDREKKAEAMSRANAALNLPFIRQLGAIEPGLREIQKKRRRIKGFNPPVGMKNLVEQELRTSYKNIQEINRILSGQIKPADRAETDAEKALELLNQTDGSLYRLVKSLESLNRAG